MTSSEQRMAADAAAPAWTGMESGGRVHAAATVVADADGRVLAFSDDFLARTGWTGAAILGCSLAELDARLARHPALKQPAGLCVLPVGQGAGQPSHHLASLREQGNTARARWDTITHGFDELLDHLPAGVVVHGPDSRAHYANPLARDLLGARIERMRRLPLSADTWSMLGEDGAALDADSNPVGRVLLTREAVNGSVVGLPGDGSLRWVICNAYPVFGAGSVLTEVVVCFTDCTELKRIEHSLLKSEERLRLALQGSTDAPWDWDLASGHVYYSERWCEMLGYEADDVKDDSRFWHASMHPDDVARVDAFTAQLLGSNERTYRVEFRLRHREGHYVPVLARGFVLRDEGGRALRLSGTNTDLTEAKAAERRIYELAYFDYLTGLPNRRLLIEQLNKIVQRCARSHQFAALLFIDLDNFKLLNDTLGHDVGDQLLRQVADRLRHAVRETDHLSRLGGDEFVVVLENLGDTEFAAVHEASLVGAKLLAALAQPYALSRRPSVSTPSIGVTVFGAETAGVDALLRQADLAMYRAKAEGRNTVRFFDPSMQAAAERQSDLENDLRDGIRRRHFELFCQPKFDIAGSLLGGEVLLRWRHERLGLLGPDDFIGLAEASGLIVPLGGLVLAESCAVLARWAGVPRLAGLSLAVNVSAKQLREADFVDQVLAALESAGAPPRRLRLELTESVFAENVEDVIAKMHALGAHGVSFSLDDFGTGYSSLSYLKRFPLAELKIDRSFVNDLPFDTNAGAIVDAILGLARTLNLQVVAEGVETGEQRRFLVEHGCQVLQGYLLGRPVPMAEFEQHWGAAAP